jgi:hypothetical protein
MKRDWSKCGITPSGEAIADMLAPAIQGALEKVRASEPSSPSSAVDDVAFIAKQVVWQIGEELGMLALGRRGKGER